MAEQVEVRTLDGQSIPIPLSPHLTVADLKSLLRSFFPPASQSPDFHLFLKGAKLRDGDSVSGIGIGSGEFLVLIPFKRKAKRSALAEGGAVAEAAAGGGAVSDSVWTDIMRDVSSLADRPRDEEEEAGDSSHVDTRCAKDSYFHEDFLDAFDLEGEGDVQETRIFAKMRGVLGKVGCLSGFRTNACLLSAEELRWKSGEAGKCVCPAWLKRIVKCFYLLNMLCGVCAIRRKRLHVRFLEEALSEPDAFGMEGVGMSDVEQLAALCPKAVVLSREDDVAYKSENGIVIFNLPIEVNSTPSCKKKLSSLSIINAVERRESKFKRDVWKSIKRGTDKRMLRNEVPFSPSLDDILAINHCNLEGSQVNLKRSRSSTSRSHCCGTEYLQPDEMVKHLSTRLGDHGQIVYVKSIDAKLPVYTEIPTCLSENTRMVLKSMGIAKLYSHQAEAIESSLAGKHVIIATSTSSGKSMCYNLPVIEEMSRNLSSCAILLFPTKALAQDQLRSILEMTKELNVDFNIGIYDGDTSQEHRAWLRNSARLLITNPDMLHISILPLHRQFERILSNLRYVVIDEAHTYIGAFGCHVALVLRRLQRVCSHVYGSDPSFIFCSATSANPREHAMELANLQNIELIEKDGSPCGSKLFLLWNPPPSFKKLQELKPKSGRKENNNSNLEARRSSPIMETAFLLAEMVQHGLRCIAFCKTRKLSELVLYYTREILKETASSLVDSISSYRAGYSVQDRRKIESELFCGKLRGVAATNALELGIDVGYIDATLHLGFPGSFASLWQQAGRSGRRAKPSLAIYVAFDGPLDQYFMKFPYKLFKGKIECCRVNACNQQVLEQHLACAAFEHPLNLNFDEKYFGSGLSNALLSLRKKGYLCGDDCGNSSLKLLRYIGPEKSPAHAISIRAIEPIKYKVIDMQSNQVFEEIEESRAFFQVYEGAVYMHLGVTYLVKKMDLLERVAFCQKSDLKYYTKTRDYTDVHVVGRELTYPAINHSDIQYLRTTARVDKCMVTTCWFGFRRIWCGSNCVFDTVDLSLPTYTYESQAVWISIPQSVKAAVNTQELSCRAGQHAASHALRNVVPLFLMCDPSDISAECANPYETRHIPERLLLYDKRPGGIGISAQMQHLFNELLIAALELVSACMCPSNSGCPNCIQVPSCDEYNEALDKKAAILILKGVIEAGKAYIDGTMSKESWDPTH